MSKRPMGHGPLKYMGDFKAVAADYEYYLTLSNEPVSVCLTERQMYILSVWNTYTSWMTRWYNTEDTSAAQLKIIAAEIEDLLMCGCGIPEPTLTDRLNSITYNNTTTATYTETYNTWNDNDQTVYSIAPNLDFGESGNPPGDIDKVMCLAIQLLLDSIIEAAKGVKASDEQSLRDMVKNLGNTLGAMATAAGAASAIGGGMAGVLAYLGGPWLVLGLALGAVGLSVANLVWTTDLSVFEDSAAKEEIRCTLVNNLLGDTPTRARFQAALSGGVFGENAAKLASIIQPYLEDLQVYLQWLSTTSQIYDVADFGVLPECDTCYVPPTLTLQTPGGWEHWTCTYIRTEGANEVWDMERHSNSGYATCVVFDPHHSFLYMDEEILEGTFTNQVAWKEWPSGTYHEDFSNHIPDDQEMDFFMRVAGSAMPNKWRVWLKPMGTH